MAERYAAATGNWSETSTWDGGASLPSTGDTVHANGFTVTVNGDYAVVSVSTRPGTTAVAGGGFTVTSGNTLTADAYAGTTHGVTVNAGGFLVGDSYGSDTTNSRYGCQLNGTQTGNATGGNGTFRYGTQVNNGGHLIGDSTGGSNSNAHGAKVSAGGIQTGDSYAATGHGTSLNGTQNGNANGGSTSGAHGTTSSNGSVLNGNGIAGTISGSHGYYMSAGGVQNGDAVGGSTSGSYGTYMTFGVFNGDVTGGSTSGAHGLYTGTTRSFIKIGTATGNTSGAYGIDSNSAGTCYSVVIIDTEVGSYAKNLDSNCETDTTNMPLFDDSGGTVTPVMSQGIQNIAGGVNL